jgi:hypothetical protein
LLKSSILESPEILPAEVSMKIVHISNNVCTRIYGFPNSSSEYFFLLASPYFLSQLSDI